VTVALGFKQSTHFLRKFKQTYEMTPTEFVELQHRVKKCRPGIANVALE
jgi:AraC-like DNA-binding protein